MDGQKVRSLAELAAALPLQMINPDSFRLLEGAPKQRRQYLDWGVFHVEHQFLPAWQRLQKSLKQRNSLLRRGRIQRSMLQPWEIELVAAGGRLMVFGQAYLHKSKPCFEVILPHLVPLGASPS